MVGIGSIETYRHEVTIIDNDGPDPLLTEMSNHLIVQSEALLEAQPRLIDYVRNTRHRGFELHVARFGRRARGVEH